MFKVKTVVREIGHKHVDLLRADGYFYFVYDNDDDLFETKSVYVMRLNDMDFEQWVEIGRDFIKAVEAGTYIPY